MTRRTRVVPNDGATWINVEIEDQEHSEPIARTLADKWGVQYGYRAGELLRMYDGAIRPGEVVYQFAVVDMFEEAAG